jgi:hypothetical protein
VNTTPVVALEKLPSERESEAVVKVFNTLDERRMVTVMILPELPHGVIVSTEMARELVRLTQEADARNARVLGEPAPEATP